MKHEPKLCPNCEAIVFWNSHFQAYYCVRCGSMLKPDEEYLRQCGGGKLVEIILKDTVKE